MTDNQDSHPPGRQPYDRLNGLRIGALVGGIVGILLVAFLGGAHAWLIFVLAILGAGAGYVWQTTDERRASESLTDQ